VVPGRVMSKEFPFLTGQTSRQKSDGRQIVGTLSTLLEKSLVA
jgi:hypothetical protein